MLVKRGHADFERLRPARCRTQITQQEGKVEERAKDRKGFERNKGLGCDPHARPSHSLPCRLEEQRRSRIGRIETDA